MKGEIMRYVSFKALENFMVEAFMAAGMPKEDSEIAAQVLISSDKRGIDSHGIGRLKPIYLDRIRQGIISPITKIEVVKESFTTAVIDGNNGMGQVVSKYAMNMAIEKAKTYGMGMVAVRNSNHYGIAGYYASMATDANMIGITGTNARPSIAPTFGIENMLGTNPLTFGIPSDDAFPFVLDCATSISQRGKIEVYERENKTLPEGWVIGSDGQARTDTEQVLKDLLSGGAALAPLGGIGDTLGGHKGYGYATVVEILSSALQGGAFLKALSGVSEGKKVPYHLGHFFIAINIENFIEIEDFKKTTGDILRALRASKKSPNEKRIYTAGEKEYLAYEERLNTGVPINDALEEDIKNIENWYGINLKD
jgi:LDH2 family malate/lactate/ureidoglycolate dehydrogenase